MKRKILIFSGAGVSKESGIETFRGSNNSLWNNFKVEDVATISAWNRNPQPVIDFYNYRRREMGGVIPNAAHEIIAKLESDFELVIIITLVHFKKNLKIHLYQDILTRF